jgi:glyoxylase-like metal-dependent hydrolase (beta-lactamase superfamily II)
MSSWVEVSDNVFQRRYHPWDVSICVVRGQDGVLLVDTRSSPQEADEIRDDLAELGDRPVRWVVNTHAHFDHTFGNQRFGPSSDLRVPIYGHRLLPAHLDAYERPRLEASPDRDEIVITPPTDLVDDRLVLDLGDRGVELVHLGRGHTDNDLLLRVPAARTWLVGDVVEESGPPMYGSGSFPLDWPATAGALLARLEVDDVVVPGHGRSVSRDFVSEQGARLQLVADLIRELRAAGVAEEQAVAAGGARWPYPAEVVRPAVADGYRQLR